MSNLTLYEIEDGLRALLDTEEMTEGEDRLAILQEIAEATELAKDKRDNVVRFLRAAEAMARAKEEEATRLSNEAKSLRRKVEQVEERCARIVAEYGTKPKDQKKHPYLMGRVFELGLRRNPEHVDLTDEEQVSSIYKTITVKMPLSEWEYVCLMTGQGEDERTSGGPEDTLDLIIRAATGSGSITVSKTAIKRAIKEQGLAVPGAGIVDGDLVLKIK